MIDISFLPKQTGIYLVKHKDKTNFHCYVGQAINIYNRFKYHHLCDYKNPNCDQYNGKFYKAIRKYGWDEFEIEILELCEPSQLDEKEIYYINKYKAFPHGYNGTCGGQFWSPNIHSPEVEEKRRQTREKNQSLMNENHPRAKLTNKEVVVIRQRYIDGESVQQIYQDYKNIYDNINVFRRIILGQTYKTVGNIPNQQSRKAAHHVGIEDKNIIYEIRQLYKNEKLSYAKLAKKYNVSVSTIQKIIRKEGYYAFV